MKRLIKTAVIGSLLWLAGCSSNTATQATATDPKDPLESLNRSVWTFNYDYLDAYVLRPATVGYMAVVPKPARTGLLNMVNNLNEPANFINSLLQGKPTGSAVSAGRFLLNSTVGVVGLFDVATPMGLAVQEEDFGQTMGVWGIGHGPYLMIPARGPSTVRNVAGDVVDNLYFPMSVLNTPQTIGKFVIGALSSREQLMAQEKLLNDSLDPYAFVKDAYFQRQDYQQYDGNPPEQSVDEAALEDFLE